MMYLFGTRWKKVIRDLWGNKSRTILVVMSIAVGILAIGVVSGSQETVSKILNESYLATNPASGSAMVRDGFDEDFVETIKGMREVEAAEGQTMLSLRYKLNPNDKWQQIRLTATENFDDSEIAKIWPEKGAWPPPDKQLVIERSSLKKMGAEIGDSIIVETSDNKEKTMKIAGTAHDLGGMPAGLSTEGSGFINLNTLEWLGEDREYTELLFIVAKDKSNRAHIEAVGDLIKKKFENQKLDVGFVRIPTPGEHPVNSVLEPLMLILSGLGGLALVLSGFLVVNTISAMLAQQTRQIGMMKIVGAQRYQIVVLYFVTVLLYGLMALLVALPLGAAGAYGLTTYLLNFFNTDLDHFSYPLSVLAIQAAIGLLVPLLAATYPIMAGTRITVREAVSDYGVGKVKNNDGLIDRLIGYLKGVSRPMLLSLRNTFRRKGRLAMTLITLTLAGATFITIFSVRASMLTTVKDMMNSFGFDMMVAFDDDYRMAEIERVIAKIPEITAAESWGRATVNRVRPDGHEGDDITLEAPPADSKMYQPEVMSGRWLQTDDKNALVITTDLQEDEPDLQVGDKVVLKLNSKETTWHIVGLVQGTMGEDPTIYANLTYFNKLTHNPDKAGMVRVALADPNALNKQGATEAFSEKFKNAGLEVERVMSLSEMQTRMESTFNFLVAFLLVMAVVLAAVGGLGLSGTMSMNVLERVREIGVMRALGASDGAVLQLVLIEGVIIGLLSWAAGTIVALPLGWLLSSLLGNSLMNKPLTYEFSLGGLGLWLIIAIVLAAIASFFPARHASQLTVREVLAYE